MRRLTWILFGLVLVIVAGFMSYTLPRQEVVRIVNVEIQRIDTSRGLFWAESETAGQDGTRDVKMIQAIRPNGAPAVYRNEDTGWGWPPFFKFDSSNVQAKAADMVSDQANPKWAVVKRYGWRSQLLSIYPNVLNVQAVAGPDDKPLPWGNIITLLTLLVLFILVYRLISRFWDRRVDPMIDRVVDVFDGDQEPTNEELLRATDPANFKK